MDVILAVANWLLPLAYLALSAGYWSCFIFQTTRRSYGLWVVATLAAHAAYLALLGLHAGRLPLATNQEVLSVVAWAAAALYWMLELLSRDRRAGAFIFSLVFLFQYTAALFLAGGPAHGPAEEVAGPWGRLHVLPAIFAYTSLTLAAVYGGLFLLGQRSLKLRRVGLLFDRLPSLDLLGRLSWHALVGGFAFMTATLVTGVIMYHHGKSAGLHQSMEPKIVVKIAIGSMAWAVCASAMVGRWIGHWSSRRISRIAVAGFLLVAAVLVSSLVFSE